MRSKIAATERYSWGVSVMQRSTQDDLVVVCPNLLKPEQDQFDVQIL